MEHVSIVVPVYKQIYLKDTIDSCLRQNSTAFEIIIFENGFKSENTEELVATYQNELEISYHFDPNGGLNRARNSGSNLSKYPIIALIDQDIILGDKWVEATLEAHKSYSDAGIIGGKVDLHFTNGDPGWCVGDFARKLSAIDYGNKETVLSGYHYLIGGNISYRKNMFNKIGGFYEKADSEFFFNDELTFHEGAKKFGNPALVYIPEMYTRHQIPSNRTTIEYMKERFVQQGICDVAYHKYLNPNWSRASLLSIMEFEMYCQDDFEEMKKVRSQLSPDMANLFTDVFFSCRMVYLNALNQATNESSKNLTGSNIGII